jgi:hypothetical protein
MLQRAGIHLAVFAMFLAWCPVHAAILGDTQTCGSAMATTERADRLPTQMLNAIGIVESGRLNLRTGVVAPWPWTINIAGKGYMFDTAAAAVAAVQTAQAAGIQSIDVGCMQVNLVYHPHAFANLEEAFDPASNVRYAAEFLLRLHAQVGDWGAAVAAYHSATPAIGASYAKIVAAVWPLATQYGLSRQDGPHSRSQCPDVDPNHLLTPEFRSQVQAAALFQCQHVAALGLGTEVIPSSVAMHGSGAYLHPAADRGNRPRGPSHSALETEVDPSGTLTPEFRAQMVAAAAFRHAVSHIDSRAGTFSVARGRPSQSTHSGDLARSSIVSSGASLAAQE